MAFNILKDGPDLSIITGFETARTYSDKRDFVYKKMAEKIKAKTFYMTEFLMLGGEIRDLVGDILFGIEYDKNEQLHIDREFQNEKVKLVTLDDSEISIKAGHKRDAVSLLYNRSNFSGAMASGKLSIKRPKIRTEKSGSLVSLTDAYLALTQKGWLVTHSPAFCKKNPAGIVKEVVPTNR